VAKSCLRSEKIHKPSAIAQSVIFKNRFGSYTKHTPETKSKFYEDLGFRIALIQICLRQAQTVLSIGIMKPF